MNALWTLPSTILAKFLTRIRNRHFLLIDVIVLCITPIAACLLRTDEILRGPALPLYILYGLGVRLLVFWWAGFYARYWRRASVDELGTLLAGNVLATLLVIAVFMTLRLPATGVCTQLPEMCELPRSLPLIDSLLVLAAVTGLRFGARLADVWNHRHVACSTAPQQVLVAGAGNAGALIVDELHANPQLGMQPIGFVDDDPEKHGIRIHGVPVLGTVAQLGAILADHPVQHVVIAMPSASGKVVRAVRDTCEVAGVKTRTIPALCTLIDGTVNVSQLRKVEIEDLLRREPVGVDTLSLRGILADKRVLVTGGGGSIGSELCRQLLRCRPAELVVLGHGENSVFEIVQELQCCVQHGTPSGEGQTRIRAYIADVRCASRMLAVFEELRPQIVFHAAAHKHVPLMEEHPAEAVNNNILGTRNVVAAAQAVGVERFVMISTDKAVRPTSVMGASKRVAELLVRRAALQSGRPYVAVRFGNVLGSRGSVVLTFKKQIERGGPVTVTDPEMKRYFMTIPEAVQLVLQAAAQGMGGEVFMLEMGEPVKIVDLARDLIQLSGLQVGRDIDIVFSGMRPGEKLYEELFTAGEHYTPTAHPRIFSAGNGNLAVPEDLDDALAALAQSAERNDRDAILRSLHYLVPSYQQGTPARPVPAAPAPAAVAKPLMDAPRPYPSVSTINGAGIAAGAGSD